MQHPLSGRAGTAVPGPSSGCDGPLGSNLLTHAGWRDLSSLEVLSLFIFVSLDLSRFRDQLRHLIQRSDVVGATWLLAA